MENTMQSSGGGNVDNETVRIFETKKILDVNSSVIENSKFAMVCMDGTCFDDISAKQVKITNANLSDLEIEGAQLGGAYFHNIGKPPKGHPMYNPDFKQRPLRFEDCDLNSSTIINCDLSQIIINDCNTTGMKINGVLVEELLEAYSKVHGR